MHLCDIFRFERNGTARWLEAAPNLEAAKARIRVLGRGSPGDYLVYTQNIDNKVVFRVGPDDAEPLEVRTSLRDDPHALIEQVLGDAIELARADFGMLQLLESITRTLKMAVQRGFSSRFEKSFGTVRAEDSCASGAVLKEGKRVIVNDIYRDPLYNEKWVLDALIDENVRAVQSMPMVTSGCELIGVLSVHYRAPGIPLERQRAISDQFLTDAADLIHTRLKGRTEYRAMR